MARRKLEHLLGLVERGFVVAERGVRAGDAERASGSAAVERGRAGEMIERFLRLLGQELDLASEHGHVDVLLVALHERLENLLRPRKLRLDCRLRRARQIGEGKGLVGRNLGQLLLGVRVDVRTSPEAELGRIADERAVREQGDDAGRLRLHAVDLFDGSVRFGERVAGEEAAGRVDGRRLFRFELVGIDEIEQGVPPERAVGRQHLERSAPDDEQCNDARNHLSLLRASLRRRGGDRVVHGGARFSEPVEIDDDVVAEIRALGELAPLHNPVNLVGIDIARRTFPDLPHVAVFDTAFHHTLPPHAYTYAVPPEWGVRRYGFHGTSHAFVSRAAARQLGREPAEVNLIVLHLGNGASATAVERGRSVDTSMGLTPLEGLVMGTRCGDVDPALVFHLQRTAGLEIDEIDRLLNGSSGLKALAGASDLREVHARAADGDEAAERGLAVYCYRIRKYVGAYLGSGPRDRVHRRGRRCRSCAPARSPASSGSGSRWTTGATAPPPASPAPSLLRAPRSRYSSCRPTRSSGWPRRRRWWRSRNRRAFQRFHRCAPLGSRIGSPCL